MSTKPDDLDLMVIHGFGKQSRKVRDLIKEKNIKILELEKTETVTYKKLDPAPKPNGDVRIIKKHVKEIRTPRQTKEEIERVEENYAKEIKPALQEKALELQEDHYVEMIDDIESRDISILVEKGLSKYKERQLEKQRELEKELEFDLDDQSLMEQYPIYIDYDDNSKELVIPSEPTDDFE
ncbi:hypothetical protein [uncultured Croceitalea sp.]|uniref:hypothetical protein n=1 Tax=uncultured Croceitalea sp. TaxID=1798908 RepID=UPI00374E8050